ncbi:MAG TPA: undecaprenyl/decaprenyl-phosphate alpha-N-acetylglucosaminyl 1-phosphate transferase, partial [Chitinophagaceae bacterium]|nr:undecaprenyl/decaprenyl-phosphate alpha-N-acetylglucosaminyl 1-phosphate transferase [Chitinophagaceae bacterium]
MVANWKKLYDLPGDRKVHSAPVPSLGGLGIFVGFMLGVLLFTNAQDVFSVFQYFIACFIVIFFFGIKDDILMLSPMKKFMGQMAVVAILMFKANMLITNMYGFLNITYIDPAVSYLLTGFTILVVMNAYNLIDGVDGLAGSLSVITCLSFGTFFLLSNDVFYALLGYSFAASLMAFLIYNYSPARIFMGDTGAMLAGAVNAILVIRFIETGEQSQILPILTTPAIGFGILMIPLLDTLRVFAIRILHGRSPFSPDRNHVHHLMLDRGYSHRK